MRVRYFLIYAKPRVWFAKELQFSQWRFQMLLSLNDMHQSVNWITGLIFFHHTRWPQFFFFGLKSQSQFNQWHSKILMQIQDRTTKGHKLIEAWHSGGQFDSLFFPFRSKYTNNQLFFDVYVTLHTHLHVIGREKMIFLVIWCLMGTIMGASDRASKHTKRLVFCRPCFLSTK